MIRYLAGEREDMIETKQQNRELDVVLTKEEEQEVTDVDVVEDESIEGGDTIMDLDDGFIEDIGYVVAEVVLKNMDDPPVFTEEREAYITDEIVDAIKAAFRTADFTEDTFQFWLETCNVIGLQVG